MGRPPLGLKLTNIRFPPDILDRIDKLVGPQRRARFIREAVVQAVENAEQGDQLKTD